MASWDRNGAGKSTLLKILSLLDSPTKGNFYYNGEMVSTKKVSLVQRIKIAIALQQSLLLHTFVFQNISLGLKIRRMPRHEIKYKVEHWLETFNIPHLINKHAYEL